MLNRIGSGFMNIKAQIATAFAVLLGIFLVVITAVKFDWIGTISRGESIIKFHSEKKETIKKEEPEKLEEDDEESQEVPIFEETNVSCVKNATENNLAVNYEMEVYFVDQAIRSTSLLVKFQYNTPAMKASFDTLVTNYNNLNTKYQGINGVTVSASQNTNAYQYTQLISYDEVIETDLTTKGLQPLFPAKDATLKQVTEYYSAQGYTCTQHE